MSDFKYISKLSRLIFIITLFFAIPSVVFAEDTNNGGKINAGELIMEHVKDSHSWHIAADITIPLPVILYSSSHGISTFCSNKLAAGQVYNGYKMDNERIVAVNSDGSLNTEDTKKLWDFSLTKNVVTVLMVGLLLIVIFVSVSRAYTKQGNKTPKGLQSFMEPVIVFIRDDVAIPSIGKKKYARYMPYLLTLFFFILFFNLLGLIPVFPGGANTMGNISIAFTLAIFTFIITLFSTNKSFWVHTLWMPGVPALIKIVLLTPLEILSIFLKPFTLIVRIFANILAGHIVILSLLCLIFIIGAISRMGGYFVSPFSVAFTAFMMLLDVLVAFIQAYVFTFLSALYFGMAQPEDEHH